MAKVSGRLTRMASVRPTGAVRSRFSSTSQRPSSRIKSRTRRPAVSCGHSTRKTEKIAWPMAFSIRSSSDPGAPYPCRSRVAIDPTRAPRSGRVQTEIKRKGQLVHAVGHKHLAGGQPKTPRLLEQSRARDKPESLVVVPRADLAQTAIARED